MRRFQFRHDRSFQRGNAQTFGCHGAEWLLIRYRDEEVCEGLAWRRWGWGLQANFSAAEFSGSNRVRVDSQSFN